MAPFYGWGQGLLQKGHACDFSEKGQKNFKKGKKGKIFENFGKNVQNLKTF